MAGESGEGGLKCFYELGHDHKRNFMKLLEAMFTKAF